MSRIFVTGDVHGNPLGKTEGKARLGTKRWPEQRNLTDDDFLVFLGDFGVLWNNRPDRRESYSIKWLDKKPFTNLVIGGNHENWDRLRSLPMEERWGAQVGIIGYRTFFIPNGTILELGGKKIFCMGGALSTDKDLRTEGVTWWAGEIPTTEEMAFGVDNLDKVDWKVDYVLTHTMPSENVGIFSLTEHRHENRIIDPTSRYFSFLVSQGLKFKGWYCGHFHEDKYYGDVRVVFHNVLELGVDTG